MKRMSSRDDFAANLKTIFDRYDDDGSGEIDAEELLEIMRSLGVQVTEEVRRRAAAPPALAGRAVALGRPVASQRARHARRRSR